MLFRKSSGPQSAPRKGRTTTILILFSGLSSLLFILLIGRMLTGDLSLIAHGVALTAMATMTFGIMLFKRLSHEVRHLQAKNRRLVATNEILADKKWREETEKDTFDAIIEARRKAEDDNTAKSKFLATVSHEIRTPLNGILGMTDLLKDTELNAKQQVYLDAVQTSGATLLNLINDVLDYSKIESGHLELNTQETDLCNLVEGVGELLAVRAHDKQIELATFVHPQVPVSLMVDPFRLKQVLFNLVGNAIKFTEKGGVLISVETVGPEIEIAVVDTGIGIENDAQAIVFNEFSQADGSIARKFGGTGLGLAITSRIIEAMGTKIALESSPGEGARFSFRLPYPGNDMLAAREVIPDLENRNIFLAMPDGPEQEVLVRSLELFGSTVVVAASPVKVQAKLAAIEAANDQLDLIILDERLWSSAQEAYEAAKCTFDVMPPAMVLTSPASDASRETLKDVGFDAYLVRPIRSASLVRLVGDILDPEPSDMKTGFLIDPADIKKIEGGAGQTSGQGGHVLLIEDNPINALLAVALLEREGCSVTNVTSGEEALDIYRKDRSIHLVLTDIHMPGLDGIETTKRLRTIEEEENLPKVPIFALTADTTKEVAREAIDAGIESILTKPINLAEIPKIVEKAFSDNEFDAQQLQRA